MVLQSTGGISPHPGARRYAMAKMKIFLAGDGFIDSLSERAPRAVSVWMPVHFPSDAFK